MWIQVLIALITNAPAIIKAIREAMKDADNKAEVAACVKGACSALPDPAQRKKLLEFLSKPETVKPVN